MIFRQPFEGGLGRVCVAIQLCPIAGGKDSGLFDRAMCGEIAQRKAQAFAMESDVLTDGNGGGGVVYA